MIYGFFRINLQDCRSELDITIIDRLIDIIENFNLLLNSFHKSADTPDDNPLDTSVDKILETAVSRNVVSFGGL